MSGEGLKCRSSSLRGGNDEAISNLYVLDCFAIARNDDKVAGEGLKCRSRLYKDMLKIVRLKTIF